MDSSPSPPDPRILFAAERTLLAWIRTGLALMGFGFVVARFGLFLREMAAVQNVATHPPGDSLAIGVALVGLGIVVMGGAGWRYRRYVAAVNAGRNPPVPGMAFGIAIAALLMAAGLGLAVYLLRAV